MCSAQPNHLFLSFNSVAGTRPRMINTISGHGRFPTHTRRRRCWWHASIHGRRRGRSAHRSSLCCCVLACGRSLTSRRAGSSPRTHSASQRTPHASAASSWATLSTTPSRSRTGVSHAPSRTYARSSTSSGKTLAADGALPWWYWPHGRRRRLLAC